MTQSYIVIFHNKTKTRKRLFLITITKQFIRNNNECLSSASSMVLKAGVDNLLKEDVEPFAVHDYNSSVRFITLPILHQNMKFTTAVNFAVNRVVEILSLSLFYLS